MVPEAPLEDTGQGLIPTGEGWFVVNAKQARWRDDGPLGKLAFFEGNGAFWEIGVNIGVLEPGHPMAMYHYENDQEDFLVVSGEALLIVEGEERPLRAWDFVHCPAGADHIIVGAGDGPCVIVSTGSRVNADGDWGSYTVDATALSHGAGVETATEDPKEAYARFPERIFTRYREGWLP
jgi:uncharacterized cupin superfamily protein